MPTDLLLEEVADLIEGEHRFGKRTVRVFASGVSVYDETETLLREVPFSEIKSARTEALVGGARLELTLKKGGVLPLAEFTASVAGRFSELARGIEQLAKGEELAISLKRPKLRCEKCDRLLPEPDGRCPACVQRGAVLKRILSYIGPYRGRAILVAVLALLSTLNSFLVPVFAGKITDTVLNAHLGTVALPKLLTLVAGILFSLVVGNAIEVLRNLNTTFLGGNIAKDLRAHIYGALEHLQLSFFDKKQIGAITSRVTQDTDRIWGFLVEGLPYMATAVLTVAGVTIFGLVTVPKLTLAILSPMPIVILGGAAIWKPISTMYHKVGARWGRFHTHLNESMNGIRVVKAFAREDSEWQKFQQRNTDLANAGIQADRRWFIAFGGMNFLTGLGNIINWVYGGYLVLKGDLTLGQFQMVQMLLWQVYGPLQWFTQVNQWFSRAMAGAERVFEVIDAQPEAYDKPGAITLERPSGEVVFDNVRFGYDKSNPVLKGITLTVKPGEMIGLVGRSGAGKSTTMNLLCRFYEADAGAVTLDGVDIRDVELQSLRRHIGIVLQEPFLFNGSIAENIAYGKPDASFDEIIAAARAACAHEFIVQKPDGYDTNVGEKGAKLSGGEKQRLSIARAILHNPKILILDEATSSVDVETEKKIQQAIGNLTAGRTTFAIAHRLSTLRNADRLVVIDKGQIAEVGTHAELMEKQGIFYNLVETQSQTSKALAENVAYTEEG